MGCLKLLAFGLDASASVVVRKRWVHSSAKRRESAREGVDFGLVGGSWLADQLDRLEAGLGELAVSFQSRAGDDHPRCGRSCGSSVVLVDQSAQHVAAENARGREPRGWVEPAGGMRSKERCGRSSLK